MEIRVKDLKMSLKGPMSPRTRAPSRTSMAGAHSPGRRVRSGSGPKSTAAWSGFMSRLFVVLALIGGLVLWNGVGGAPVVVQLRIDRSGSVVMTGTFTPAHGGPVRRK
jgi:hypothetical protein